ncbi:hypothetical protein M422DRAFT_276822 [Sphaerobolus stellatus SS14]|uniref:Uncharacterized protein n=1 Tax=Sphaerobolus stellatus (strain SS14) TaxID=990650 RepID=A0A0C9TLG0_SPHS4|nr:hypothetical protein M422DRAFT_276822 [Sphaerobolus stellatus SS14]
MSPPNTAGVGFGYSTSPPSRFFSPPPTQASFGMATSNFPRSNPPNTYGPPFSGPGSASGSGSQSQHSPPFLTDGDERLRYRDPSPQHAFGPTPGLETTTRVG